MPSYIVEEKPSWEEIGRMTEEIRILGLKLAAAEGEISGLTGAMDERYDEYQFFRQQLKEEKGQLEVKLAAAELEQGRLKAAIEACLNHANNRESEWGSRAEESFAFLYDALKKSKERNDVQNSFRYHHFVQRESIEKQLVASELERDRLISAIESYINSKNCAGKDVSVTILHDALEIQDFPK